MWTRLAGAGGFLLLFAAAALPAVAAGSPTFVPEIDPGSTASALTLLAGGIMVLTSRLRK